jgi:hypothetical protein
VTNFQEETRQEILIVKRVERMAERMNDELTQSVAEAKASQEGGCGITVLIRKRWRVVWALFVLRCVN